MENDKPACSSVQYDSMHISNVREKRKRTPKKKSEVKHDGRTSDHTESTSQCEVVSCDIRLEGSESENVQESSLLPTVSQNHNINVELENGMENYICPDIVHSELGANVEISQLSDSESQRQGKFFVEPEETKKRIVKRKKAKNIPSLSALISFSEEIRVPVNNAGSSYCKVNSRRESRNPKVGVSNFKSKVESDKHVEEEKDKPISDVQHVMDSDVTNSQDISTENVVGQSLKTVDLVSTVSKGVKRKTRLASQGPPSKERKVSNEPFDGVENSVSSDHSVAAKSMPKHQEIVTSSKTHSKSLHCNSKSPLTVKQQVMVLRSKAKSKCKPTLKGKMKKEMVALKYGKKSAKRSLSTNLIESSSVSSFPKKKNKDVHKQKRQGATAVRKGLSSSAKSSVQKTDKACARGRRRIISYGKYEHFYAGVETVDSNTPSIIVTKNYSRVKPSASDSNTVIKESNHPEDPFTLTVQDDEKQMADFDFDMAYISSEFTGYSRPTSSTAKKQEAVNRPQSLCGQITKKNSQNSFQADQPLSLSVKKPEDSMEKEVTEKKGRKQATDSISFAQDSTVISAEICQSVRVLNSLETDKEDIKTDFIATKSGNQETAENKDSLSSPIKTYATLAVSKGSISTPIKTYSAPAANKNILSSVKPCSIPAANKGNVSSPIKIYSTPASSKNSLSSPVKPCSTPTVNSSSLSSPIKPCSTSEAEVSSKTPKRMHKSLRSSVGRKQKIAADKTKQNLMEVNNEQQKFVKKPKTEVKPCQLLNTVAEEKVNPNVSPKAIDISAKRELRKNVIFRPGIPACFIQKSDVTAKTDGIMKTDLKGSTAASGVFATCSTPLTKGKTPALVLSPNLSPVLLNLKEPDCNKPPVANKETVNKSPQKFVTLIFQKSPIKKPQQVTEPLKLLNPAIGSSVKSTVKNTMLLLPKNDLGSKSEISPMQPCPPTVKTMLPSEFFQKISGHVQLKSPVLEKTIPQLKPDQETISEIAEVKGMSSVTSTLPEVTKSETLPDRPEVKSPSLETSGSRAASTRVKMRQKLPVSSLLKAKACHLRKSASSVKRELSKNRMGTARKSCSPRKRSPSSCREMEKQEQRLKVDWDKVGNEKVVLKPLDTSSISMKIRVNSSASAETLEDSTCIKETEKTKVTPLKIEHQQSVPVENLSSKINTTELKASGLVPFGNIVEKNSTEAKEIVEKTKDPKHVPIAIQPKQTDCGKTTQTLTKSELENIKSKDSTEAKVEFVGNFRNPQGESSNQTCVLDSHVLKSASVNSSLQTSTLNMPQVSGIIRQEQGPQKGKGKQIVVRLFPPFLSQNSNQNPKTQTQPNASSGQHSVTANAKRENVLQSHPRVCVLHPENLMAGGNVGKTFYLVPNLVSAQNDGRLNFSLSSQKMANNQVSPQSSNPVQADANNTQPFTLQQVERLIAAANLQNLQGRIVPEPKPQNAEGVANSSVSKTDSPVISPKKVTDMGTPSSVSRTQVTDCSSSSQTKKRIIVLPSNISAKMKHERKTQFIKFGHVPEVPVSQQTTSVQDTSSNFTSSGSKQKKIAVKVRTQKCTKKRSPSASRQEKQTVVHDDDSVLTVSSKKTKTSDCKNMPDPTPSTSRVGTLPKKRKRKVNSNSVKSEKFKSETSPIRRSGRKRCPPKWLRVSESSNTLPSDDSSDENEEILNKEVCTSHESTKEKSELKATVTKTNSSIASPVSSKTKTEPEKPDTKSVVKVPVAKKEKQLDWNVRIKDMINRFSLASQ